MSTSELSLPSVSSSYTLQDIELIADYVGKSGLFGMGKPQAFVLMMLASAKGLRPIEALERYHIIQGRPSMKSEAMLAEFQAHGGTVKWVERTDTAHEAVFFHPVHAPEGESIRFTLDDARRAELLGNKMWAKYPSNMLRARVISNGVHLVMPGIVLGIYTPEEASDMEPTAYPAPKVVDVTPRAPRGTTARLSRPQQVQIEAQIERAKIEAPTASSASTMPAATIAASFLASPVDHDAPPPPISPGQAERIHVLVGHVGMTSHQYQAALARRGVTTVEQLNAWDAGEIIRKLEARLDADGFDWGLGKQVGEDGKVGEGGEAGEDEAEIGSETTAIVNSDRVEPADDFEIPDQARRPELAGAHVVS